MGNPKHKQIFDLKSLVYTIAVEHKLFCKLQLLPISQTKWLIMTFVFQVRKVHVSAVVASEAGQRLKKFDIYRWNPDKPEEKPQMQQYFVDLNT